MKLTELILQLHTIMLEKGNLDVFVDSDVGAQEPTVHLVEEDYLPYYRPGVYLN
jgi:hypothetical protein